MSAIFLPIPLTVYNGKIIWVLSKLPCGYLISGDLISTPNILASLIISTSRPFNLINSKKNEMDL